MTATIDPEIQARYEQNATAQRSAEAAVSTELKAKQQEVSERVKATEEAFAKIGRALSEPKRPEPARRPEDNDLSAKAEAYQEADDDPPPAVPPPPPAPAVRRAEEDEEVASFHWDEDPPKPKPEPAPQPRAVEEPAAKPAKPRPREEEDLSDHDWLE